MSWSATATTNAATSPSTGRPRARLHSASWLSSVWNFARAGATATSSGVSTIPAVMPPIMARGCVIYSDPAPPGGGEGPPGAPPRTDRGGWRQPMNDSDPIADTAALAPKEFGTPARVEEQWIKLLQPAKGDPGLTVLRVLGLAQDAPTVGAAAHGPNGVAIGVWSRPELYVARWTKGKRWVVGYKLAGDAKPNMFIRTE